VGFFDTGFDVALADGLEVFVLVIGAKEGFKVGINEAFTDNLRLGLVDGRPLRTSDGWMLFFLKLFSDGAFVGLNSNCIYGNGKNCKAIHEVDFSDSMWKYMITYGCFGCLLGDLSRRSPGNNEVFGRLSTE